MYAVGKRGGRWKEVRDGECEVRGMGVKGEEWKGMGGGEWESASGGGG